MKHHRQFLSILATLSGLFGIAVAAFIGAVHISDREEFADLKKELRDQFVSSRATAKLVYKHRDRRGEVRNLDGEEVDVETVQLTDPDDKKLHWYVRFPYIIKNESPVISGKYQEVMYAYDNVFVDYPNADSSIDYKFQANVTKIGDYGRTGSLWEEEIPGNFSKPDYMSWHTVNDARPPRLNRYKVLLRIYFEGTSSEATIYLSEKSQDRK